MNKEKFKFLSIFYEMFYNNFKIKLEASIMFHNEEDEERFIKIFKCTFVGVILTAVIYTVIVYLMINYL